MPVRIAAPILAAVTRVRALAHGAALMRFIAAKRGLAAALHCGRSDGSPPARYFRAQRTAPRGEKRCLKSAASAGQFRTTWIPIPYGAVASLCMTAQDQGPDARSDGRAVVDGLRYETLTCGYVPEATLEGRRPWKSNHNWRFTDTSFSRHVPHQ